MLETHRHLPVPERDLVGDKVAVICSVYIVAKAARAAFCPVYMYIVKVLVPIPEIGH